MKEKTIKNIKNKKAHYFLRYVYETININTKFYHHYLKW